MIKKNKKTILSIIVIILLIISILFVINNIPLTNDNIIVLKANIMFGHSSCPTNNPDYHSEKDLDHFGFYATVMTPYKCGVCRKNTESSSSFIPKMCRSCAKITGRCEKCGKLKNSLHF